MKRQTNGTHIFGIEHSKRYWNKVALFLVRKTLHKIKMPEWLLDWDK